MIALSTGSDGGSASGPPLAVRAACAAEPIEARPPRLLLVEDEFLVGAQLHQELSTAGFRVLGPFGTLAEARAAARGAAFDLALLDVNLRGEKVYPLADELVRLGVPFVFLSGYTTQDLPERFRDLPRLSKPHDAPALVLELRRVLAGA